MALVAANLFVVGFGVSWGPVVWVLLGEMFPNAVRAPALAVAAAAQWLANFAVSTSFPWMSENLGLAVTYGMYAVFALLSGLFVLTQVRETKGRELEDMTGETGRDRQTGRRPLTPARRLLTLLPTVRSGRTVERATYARSRTESPQILLSGVPARLRCAEQVKPRRDRRDRREDTPT